MNFKPNYQHIIDAARNKLPSRLPLYEHGISTNVIEKIINRKFAHLLGGSYADKKEYFRIFTQFCSDHGYDVIPFEGCVVNIVQKGAGICGLAESIIQNQKDLESYPWEEMPERYFALYDETFQALAEILPSGMKAIGGVGNGVFETVQDFVPLTELSFLQVDYPEVYEALWGKVGEVMFRIWQIFLERYKESFAVCRFGDDLGFSSSTLINPNDIRKFIIPQYKRVVDLVHQHNKPFLLHSCGAIFPVMDDIIELTGIDAKHSNEDNIAPFSRWVADYGDKIGNFGGIEMNVLCLNTPAEIDEYVLNVLQETVGKPGIAIGSGNQIADYIPPEGFLAMVETVRKFRGE
jgi:uroporphyrinogen decarboxylase